MTIITYNGFEQDNEDCIWIECLNSYWPNANICLEHDIEAAVYCEYQGEWFVPGVGGCVELDSHYNDGVEISHEDYCVYVHIDFNDDVMVLETIFDDDGQWFEDNRWLNSETLNDCGVYWRNCCDEYVHEDDSCCGYDDDDDNDFERFNNSFKVTSPTFIKTCGMKYTFGVEIETTAPDYLSSYQANQNNLSLSAVYDGSVSGAEYVSGVLQGDKGVDMLYEICDALSICSVNRSCGFHVHIGGFQDNRRFSLLALRLGVMLEKEFYNMLPPSRQSSSYCKPIGYLLPELKFSNINKILANYVFGEEELNKYYNKKTHSERYSRHRYRWLNLINCNSRSRFTTIEFRQHSGTTNFNKAYNWMLICMSFVNFVENQPRRIMQGNVTLQEVVRYSLKGEISDNVIAYIKSRYEKFGNEFTLESPSFHNLSKQRIDNINEFLKQLNNVEKQREVFRAKNGRVFSA